jgi:DNA polymerase IV
MKNDTSMPHLSDITPVTADNTRYMLNTALPYIIHIDLNSCFAIIEQQANRLLRGKPVGIAAYDTPRGFVIAASYEAKAKGVKLGVNVEQSRALAPGIIILTPDPPKYREAHRRFKAVLQDYSSVVIPKSIDEFIVDLSDSPALRRKILDIRREQATTKAPKISNITSKISNFDRQVHNTAMLEIGKEIKKRIAESLGEWVTVNVGIGTNRFLAKYAAGFGKPDGMTLIDHTNLLSKYDNQKLVDLPGINVRYRARLRIAGIYTPLDFLAADMNLLKKQVFKSINGYHWYRRLRGYEADAVEFSRKSIGHQYALPQKTTDKLKLERLLMKLCEKTGRRLRKNNYYASGIHLYLGFASDQPQWDDPASFEHMHKMRSWHHGEKVQYRLYSTSDIYEAAKRLLYQAAFEESDGLHTSDSFGAATKHGTNGIEIPSREYWSGQAKNSEELSGVPDSVRKQSERCAFRQRVKIMSVHVFGLEPWDPEQLTIFDIAKPTEQDGKGIYAQQGHASVFLTPLML